MSEENDMNRGFRWDWTFNVPIIVTIVASAVSLGMYAQAIDSRVGNLEEYKRINIDANTRSELRQQSMDNRLVRIETLLENIEKAASGK